MGQLGSTLKRLVAVMVDNYNPDFLFLFTNIDIADGFWHLVISHLQAWNFCYVLPDADGWHVSLGETELVVPKDLQMGWCESTPFFYEGSETTREIISYIMKGNTTIPWNNFELVMIPNYLHPTKPQKNSGYHRGICPVDIIEVFIHYFIGAINNSDLTHFLHLSRCMLHGIYTISPSSEVTQHGGFDSVS